MNSRVLILLGFLGLGLVQGGVVDRDAVNSLYFGGDLDAVAAKLLPLMESGQSFSKSDSIFIYKNLSVVMAADPATRAKAQSYMYKLFVLAPSVDIIDMYVSDTIYMMFQNVKKEFAARNSYNQAKDKIENASDGKPSPIAKAGKSDPPGKKSNWLFWTVSGVALTGGITAYLLMDQKKDERKPPILSNEPANP